MLEGSAMGWFSSLGGIYKAAMISREDAETQLTPLLPVYFPFVLVIFVFYPCSFRPFSFVLLFDKIDVIILSWLFITMLTKPKMKKAYYLLLFVLLLSATANAQTTWITKNLDERLSVKFPAEPQKTIRNGIDVYTLRQADSTAYSASVIDYKVVVHLDSAALAPVKDNQQFADQMKKGLASVKPNYTFGDITIGNWKTYTTYSLSGSENTTKGTLFIQMILIGSKMYSLSCRVPVNLVTKNKEEFLSSAELLKK
jgi:hypothetical protein